MRAIISAGMIFLGILSVASVVRADSADVFVSGSLFSYNDQTAVTFTNALAGSPQGTAPTGACFNAQLNLAACSSSDFNPPGLGSVDFGTANATGDPNGVQTSLGVNTSTAVSGAKTNFVAAAAFARAGADMSGQGILAGGQPVVDLDGIILFGNQDPLSSLFAFEVTNQTPKVTGAGSKVLNQDILSQSIGGVSGLTVLGGLPAGYSLAPPPTIYYKLVLGLDASGAFSIDQSGMLLPPGGGVSLEDFSSLVFCGPVACPPGTVQRTLVHNGQSHIQFNLNAIPGLTAGNNDISFSADQIKFVVASAVPEPATWLLLCTGLGALVLWRRRQRIVNSP